jgi:hypothetical protein
MKKSIIKSLVLVVLVLVFAIAFVSPSEAEKKIKPIVLEGTYGVTGQDICVVHWTTPPGGEPGDPTTYWTKTSTMQGTAIFNSNGTGSTEVDEVTIIHPIYTPIPIGPYFGGTYPQPGLPLGSVSTDHVSTTFDYKIDPVTRSIVRTITSGLGTLSSGLPGKTFTFTIFDTLGYVSLDTQTIIAASPVYNPNLGPPPELEDPIMTVTIKNSDGSLYGVQDQMCQRIRNAVLIK